MKARGPGALERGRRCHEERQWAEAYEALAAADEETPLAADDLWRLVWAAGLSGAVPAMLQGLERLYHLYVTAKAPARAARAAFWLGLRLSALGDVGRAGGWLERARRLTDDTDCVERGYLLVPEGHRRFAGGDLQAAYEAASAAAAVGERFGDADLVALGRQLQGRALVYQGELTRGVALLDEVMLVVASGDVSPTVTGLVYCAVIAAFSNVHALERAREWTAALGAWWQTQPQLVAFSGVCLVHRSEILQLGGAWPEAMDEARRAGERSAVTDPDAAARACYQEGELHRLRGELEASEAAYRRASQRGREPQPGLALLRLAQGDRAAALAAIRRVLEGAADRLQRSRYLPAQVEIALAAGERDEARAACRELEASAAVWNLPVLEALAAEAGGAVSLAEGETGPAIARLREAFGIWQQIGAPYLAARVRVLLARACQTLGDVDGARLELEAAREVFRRFGAAPDLAAADALAAGLDGEPRAGRLTARELQVLRLVARGLTNKEVATELGLAEKTVDRHVSNIFAKIDVSTRAAATAYAYQHELVPRRG